MKRLLWSAFAMCLGVTGLPGAATAQTIAGCTVETRDDPVRQVYVCAGGLTIEAEAAARLTFFTTAPDAAPHAVGVEGGSVLIEIDPEQADPDAPAFQIRTPQAIASVRGTIYAVEVTETASAVFVVRGLVGVTAQTGGRGVRLGPGEGVDVAPGQPLVVKVWGPARAAALLARFGR